MAQFVFSPSKHETPKFGFLDYNAAASMGAATPTHTPAPLLPRPDVPPPPPPPADTGPEALLHAARAWYMEYWQSTWGTPISVPAGVSTPSSAALPSPLSNVVGSPASSRGPDGDAKPIGAGRTATSTSLTTIAGIPRGIPVGGWLQSIKEAVLHRGMVPMCGGDAILGPVMSIVLSIQAAKTSGKLGSVRKVDPRWQATVKSPSFPRHGPVPKSARSYFVGAPVKAHAGLMRLAHTFATSAAAVIERGHPFRGNTLPCFSVEPDNFFTPEEAVLGHPNGASYVTSNIFQDIVRRRRARDILKGVQPEDSAVARVIDIASYAEAVLKKRLAKGNVRDGRVRNTMAEVLHGMLVDIFRTFIVVPADTLKSLFPFWNAVRNVLTEHKVAEVLRGTESARIRVPCYIAKASVLATVPGGVAAGRARGAEMVARIMDDALAGAWFTVNEASFLFKIRARYIDLVNTGCAFGIKKPSSSTRSRVRRSLASLAVSTDHRRQVPCNQFRLPIVVKGFVGVDGIFHEVHETCINPEPVPTRTAGVVAGKAMHQYFQNVLDAFEAGAINEDVVRLALECRGWSSWHRGGPPTGIINAGNLDRATSLIVRLLSRVLVIMGSIGSDGTIGDGAQSVSDAARFARYAQRIFLLAGLAVDIVDPSTLSDRDRDVLELRMNPRALRRARKNLAARREKAGAPPPAPRARGRPAGKRARGMDKAKDMNLVPGILAAPLRWDAVYAEYCAEVADLRRTSSPMPEQRRTYYRDAFCSFRSVKTAAYMTVRSRTIGEGINTSLPKIQENFTDITNADPCAEGPGLRFIETKVLLQGGEILFTMLYNTPTAQNDDPDHTQFIYSAILTRGAVITLTGVYTTTEARLALEQVYTMVRPYIKNLTIMTAIDDSHSLKAQNVVDEIRKQCAANEPDNLVGAGMASENAIIATAAAMVGVADAYYQPIPISAAVLRRVYRGAVSVPYGLVSAETGSGTGAGAGAGGPAGAGSGSSGGEETLAHPSKRQRTTPTP